MHLKEMTAHLLDVLRIEGDDTVEITGIQMDSRNIRPGELFVCIPGVDGILEDRHPFVQDAVSQGAAALVVEREVDADAGIPRVCVKDARYALASLSALYYDFPSRRMKVIGITGTNGKTTTSHLIDHLLRHQGLTTGIMGNIFTRIGSEKVTFANNTQEPPDLQRNLRKMADMHTDYCVMEVTSQGLDLGRVIGTRFRTAVFTNLTQDHLDYHHTMEAYKEAKGRLFARLGNAAGPEGSFAVLNADDAASEYFRKQTAAQVITYGISKDADVTATDIRLTSAGTECTVSFRGKSERVQLPLVGLFNVYNMLAAFSTLLIEGISLTSLAEGIKKMKPVKGRMEMVDAGQNFAVFIDYAHTPDGLEESLRTVREFARGKVIVVFGCGGDRDRAKRPVMGSIAGRYCDRIILTSDNPRNENPTTIMLDIRQGLEASGLSVDRYEMIEDRNEGIRRAIQWADLDDVVIVAGKGHETYQIIRGRSHPFDDRQVVLEALAEKASKL
ncbi:UDP-N-acetylmuramoyl-L-alanyl-D-glutamate--2,6-diaminopimelate ligase [Paenibacillus sp. UNC451MF]|uniref:UDP-N-acetylmuramoyl-L-alanyl-D-glutamate--2, 6-diaminopimelate ligase n=1 Tax=Paenibacillus sp. UNC451MF TaxID=1449063 RepID=UPI00048F82E5|nr:UDP-N-acetylmuramoyl-L-alanyl-D-glutamate--2,6-diaminopimelate ligase [Paenibacillus sp. UNC451MF]